LYSIPPLNKNGDESFLGYDEMMALQRHDNDASDE